MSWEKNGDSGVVELATLKIVVRECHVWISDFGVGVVKDVDNFKVWGMGGWHGMEEKVIRYEEVKELRSLSVLDVLCHTFFKLSSF